YCNETDSSGCTASTSLGALSRGAGIYTLAVTGLSPPNDPGNTLNLRVVATDVDGVGGSALDGTVTLSQPPADDITISNLTTSNIGPDGFTATVDFTGDANANASVTLWYCNHSDSAACDSTTGVSVAMGRSADKFVAIISNLTAPNDPGNTLNI